MMTIWACGAILCFLVFFFVVGVGMVFPPAWIVGMFLSAMWPVFALVVLLLACSAKGRNRLRTWVQEERAAMKRCREIER